jgi:hypothetical protein
MTTDVEFNSDTQMFVLDESALTWKIYQMDNGSDKFTEAGSGTLTVGTPELKTRAFGTPMKTSSGAVATK